MLSNDQKRKAMRAQQELAECDLVKKKLSDNGLLTFYDLAGLSTPNDVCSIKDLGYEKHCFTEKELYNLSLEQRAKYEMDTNNEYWCWPMSHFYYLKIGDNFNAKIMPN
ncbi:MAG: hypothetical protein JKY62_12695 [Desulfocapsa sp.]|nr:hypothetical protein [Desulfocapsa sp.]